MPAELADPANRAAAATVVVEVAYSPQPRVVEVVPLKVAPGTTAAEAVRASGLVQRHGLAEATLAFGIWGRACEPQAALRERDRVEIYRPLKVDPKEARRQRYKRHRERATGGTEAPPPAGAPAPGASRAVPG